MYYRLIVFISFSLFYFELYSQTGEVDFLNCACLCNCITGEPEVIPHEIKDDNNSPLLISFSNSINDVVIPNSDRRKLKDKGFTGVPSNTYVARLSKSDGYFIVENRWFAEGIEYAILVVAEAGVSDIDGKLENYTTNNLITSSTWSGDKSFIMYYTPTYSNYVEIYANVHSAVSSAKYQVKVFIFIK